VKKSISLAIILALVFSLLAPIGGYAEESNLDKLYNRFYSSRLGKAFRETDLITVDELFDIRDELKGKGYVSDFINSVYDEINKNEELKQFLYGKYYVSRENVNNLKDIVFDWEDDYNENLRTILNSFKSNTKAKPDEWDITIRALKDSISGEFSDEIRTIKAQLKEEYRSNYGLLELSLDLTKAVLDNLIVKETNTNPDLDFSVDKNGLYQAIESIEDKYIANDEYKLTESFTLSQLSAVMDGIIEEAENYYETIKPVVKEKAGLSDKQIAGIIKNIVSEGNYISYTEPTPPTPPAPGGGVPVPSEPQLPEVTVPEDKNMPASATLGNEQVNVSVREQSAYVSLDSRTAVRTVEKLRSEAGKDREAVLNINLSGVKSGSINVEFPYDLIKAAVDNNVSLNLVFDDVEVLVPFDVLDAAGIEKGDKVVFRTEDVTELVSELAGEDQEVRMGVDLYLEVVRNGNVIRIDEFKTPIVVKIELKGLWNRDKLAVYYLDEENNTLEFVTGKVTGNHIIIRLSHFSKYLVIESYKTFSDIENHWAKLFIESMAAKNVVDGYSDGTFRPGNNVTRAEFSKMILKGLEVQLVKYNGEFKDVKANDWYADYLATMKKLGLAEGYDDGTFRPDKYITRAEIAVILSNVLDVEVDEDEIDTLLAGYLDKDQIPDWARLAIAKVVKSRVMVGDNNRFNPSDNTTRAESATTIYRIYNIIK